MPGIIPQVIVAAVTAVAQTKVKAFMNAQLNMGTKKAPAFARAFGLDNLLLCKPVIQLGAGDKGALRPPVGFARAYRHLGDSSEFAIAYNCVIRGSCLEH